MRRYRITPVTGFAFDLFLEATPAAIMDAMAHGFVLLGYHKLVNGDEPAGKPVLINAGHIVAITERET